MTNIPQNQNNKDVATYESSNRSVGFGSQTGFDMLQRQAKMLSSSNLVPEQFSIFDKNGKLKSSQDQVYAQANAAIAIEIAARIGASPIMVAQNLYIVHGRPGWSSQFIIAAINASGKFSPLRFEVTGSGDEKTCVAWAIENNTGQRLESSPVSIAMAKSEGWYGKNGSKWNTMDDQMLRYRSASFFGRVYAPEILMGMRGVEEIEDIIEVHSHDDEYRQHANQKLIDIENEPPAGVDPETGEISGNDSLAADMALAGDHYSAAPGRMF